MEPFLNVGQHKYNYKIYLARLISETRRINNKKTTTKQSQQTPHPHIDTTNKPNTLPNILSNTIHHAR